MTLQISSACFYHKKIYVERGGAMILEGKILQVIAYLFSTCKDK